MSGLTSSIALGGRKSGILIAIIGIIFAAVGFFMMSDNNATKDWPSVAGTTQEVRSERRYDSSDDTSRTEYRYSVAYSVNGKDYKTTGETSSTYVNNGESRQVRYNPSNPDDARVGTASGWFSWIFVVVGVIVTIFGLVTMIKSSGSSSDTPVSEAVPPFTQPRL